MLDRQLPLALEQQPDLVSLVGGGNDTLRPGADVDALARRVEEAVIMLRGRGIDVLLATPTDPKGAPVLSLIRPKSAVYLAHLNTIARRHGCALIDQWGIDDLKDPRMWAEDRLHMTPEGHARVAQAAHRALAELPSDDGTGLDAVPLVEPDPLPPLERRARREVAREHAQWGREYLAPWVQRRLTGRSSGDGLDAKRPVLELVDPDEQLPAPRF